MLLLDMPKDYSQMLNRIFVCTFFVALACTYALGRASPLVDSHLRLFRDVKFKTSMVDLDGVPILYLVVPAIIALLTRIFKLHDLISDALGLRKAYDLKHILVPLATGVGWEVDAQFRNRIAQKRRVLMSRCFYAYAGSDDPAIGEHLVRSALDNLGWYWVGVEASVIVLVMTALMRAYADAWHFNASLVALGIVLVFCVVLGRICVGTTSVEVEAILGDPSRRKAIADEFNAI